MAKIKYDCGCLIIVKDTDLEKLIDTSDRYKGILADYQKVCKMHQQGIRKAINDEVVIG